MKSFFSRLLREEDGATAIEYGLIAALVAVAAIAALTTLGQSLDAIFTSVSNQLSGAASSSGSGGGGSGTP
jgi:pilus assembly protein Flp/PilA